MLSRFTRKNSIRTQRWWWERVAFNLGVEGQAGDHEVYRAVSQNEPGGKTITSPEKHILVDTDGQIPPTKVWVDISPYPDNYVPKGTSLFLSRSIENSAVRTTNSPDESVSEKSVKRISFSSSDDLKWAVK